MVAAQMSNDLDQERRFGFGENWLDFSQELSADQIEEAEKSIRRLLQRDTLAGLTFLDIGSGSGLFSLAACRLGARVHSFDYDAKSVRSTMLVRNRYFPDSDWKVERGSILDRDYVHKLGRFDIVYAWGVLHHTGALHDALEMAASLVVPGGLFAFALYHRTRMCGLWRWEKRWYCGASSHAQQRARAVYVALLRLRFALTGSDFRSFVENYKGLRGMSFMHNVHDWMGGYPYESISGPEVEALMRRFELTPIYSAPTPVTIGFFGSGCDEYVYRRPG